MTSIIRLTLSASVLFIIISCTSLYTVAFSPPAGQQQQLHTICNIHQTTTLQQQSQQLHQKQCSKSSSILFMSSNGDGLLDFDDDDDDNENNEVYIPTDMGSQAVSNVFQTEGGVIMPEGTANPCVIKVTTIVCMILFYIAGRVTICSY